MKVSLTGRQFPLTRTRVLTHDVFRAPTFTRNRGPGLRIRARVLLCFFPRREKVQSDTFSRAIKLAEGQTSTSGKRYLRLEASLIFVEINAMLTSSRAKKKRF